MTNKPINPDVAVVGGGLAGLVAAATVAKAGKSVVVYEARTRAGGRGTTDNHEGFFFNQGPHALYMGGAAEQAFTRLGVSMDGGRPKAKGHAVVDGQKYVVPSGPASLIQTKALSVKSKTQFGRLLQQLPKLDPRAFADQTVEEWIAASMSRPDGTAMLEAFVRLATYTNAPNFLSADVAIHQLQASLSAGVRYVDRGWQTLVDQLAAHPGVAIETGSKLATLPEAKAVIIAAGGPRVAETLLDTSFEVGPPALVATLDLGVARPPSTNFVLGVSTPHYFSNHSSVADVAPAGHYHVAVAKYLPDPDLNDDAELLHFVRYSGLEDSDIVAKKSQTRSAAVSAIPVASLGGMQGRPDIADTGLPGVFIAGDWVGPDGHLLDAAAASAIRAANAALAAVDS